MKDIEGKRLRKRIDALQIELEDRNADNAALALDYANVCEKQRKVKDAVRSMTERMMTYLTQPTTDHLYSVHQILRDVEALLGDLDFRR